MSRRHLFDNGFPASRGTLLLGSVVLLAVSRQAGRSSRFRLATSLLRLAGSSQRLTASLARHDRSHLDLVNSRENYARLLTHAQAQATHARAQIEAGAGGEPGERPASEAPHRA